MAKRKLKRLLLLTPPFVQTNTPYPATMHLTGFLRERGVEVFQRDLSIKVVRDILLEYGDETTDELLELLSGNASAENKMAASEIIDELALAIRDEVDPCFGFSRYAERISANAANFSMVEKLIRRRGIMDEPLERHLEAAIEETHPDVIGVTCPFPGTLVAAFKIAQYVRRNYPKIKLLLGGGFVSSELRDMNDERAKKYFDAFQFDEGYAGMLSLMTGLPVDEADIPLFVKPSYDGIEWSEYFDVVETSNPMHRLWSVGRWRKLVMSRGCYWGKCAFCDVKLPYIKCFAMPEAKAIVDAMAELGGDVHFVDEAMPPKLVKEVSEEILNRKLKCRWWGNVRFDGSWTASLTRLAARAGCIAVTGGLECANDRLLKLMNKGITLEGAQKALNAFKSAGIMVHAYLMYGFPTETEAEAFGALKYVRDLFKAGLIDSAFWHRFALTVHSPIAAAPEKFSIIPIVSKRRGRIFCRNEIPFYEPLAPDWDRIGASLNLALRNYLEGRGLNRSMKFWQTHA